MIDSVAYLKAIIAIPKIQKRRKGEQELTKIYFRCMHYKGTLNFRMLIVFLYQFQPNGAFMYRKI